MHDATELHSRPILLTTHVKTINLDHSVYRTTPASYFIWQLPTHFPRELRRRSDDCDAL